MSSAYESASQKIIPAVLLYAFHQDSVLMIHRITKANDFHQGKWNGLGGKIELGETPVQAATREFSEEAGVFVPTSQWEWMGQLYFPNFKPAKHEDWWVNVFVTSLTDEQVSKIPLDDASSAEGRLHFIKNGDVLNLNLWDGDRHFLPLVLSKTPFQGTFFYRDGKCERFELSKILN